MEREATVDEIEVALRTFLPEQGQLNDVQKVPNQGVWFSWRGQRFRASTHLMVEEVNGSRFLAGTSLTALMQKMLYQSLRQLVHEK